MSPKKTTTIPDTDPPPAAPEPEVVVTPAPEPPTTVELSAEKYAHMAALLKQLGYDVERM